MPVKIFFLLISAVIVTAGLSVAAVALFITPIGSIAPYVLGLISVGAMLAVFELRRRNG